MNTEYLFNRSDVLLCDKQIFSVEILTENLRELLTKDVFETLFCLHEVGSLIFVVHIDSHIDQKKRITPEINSM